MFATFDKERRIAVKARRLPRRGEAIRGRRRELYVQAHFRSRRPHASTAARRTSGCGSRSPHATRRAARGVLSNTPGYATNLAQGRPVTVAREKAADWLMHLKDGGTAGGDSIKALEKRRLQVVARSAIALHTPGMHARRENPRPRSVRRDAASIAASIPACGGDDGTNDLGCGDPTKPPAAAPTAAGSRHPRRERDPFRRRRRARSASDAERLHHRRQRPAISTPSRARASQSTSRSPMRASSPAADSSPSSTATPAPAR